MNFLNPFALIGMAAAGIPLLLHLLNLRRLKTIDFGTLRFLQELQQKQVRKLRLQQILLLILRTLVLICAVLALARPTIESTLPILGATSRSSVVILVDNSASMEAADGSGPRIDQAKKIVRQIIAGLRDGDEVIVLPMTGNDPDRQIDFTRTFPAALEQAEGIALTDGTANLVASLRMISPLLDRALHAHKEVYVVSDAQQSIAWRNVGDSSLATRHDASFFLVRIGNGQQGMEPNLSVDSVNVLTKLFQANKPIEIEAFVRNGSNRDMEGALVSLAFDGRRIAQSTIDVPAMSTRRITLAATPQKIGLVSASIELESDAIDRDNTRYAGVLIPAPSRIGLIGSQTEVSFVRTVLSLPGTGSNAPRVTWFPTISQASASFAQLDAIIVTGGTYTTADASLLRQFIEAGGGALVFAGVGVDPLTSACGLQIGQLRTTSAESPFTVTTIDKTNPLYSGVFLSPQDQSAALETARILEIRPASGGFDIVQTTGGALVSEVTVGQGRLLYVGVSPTLESGTFPLTGLFAATTLRSSVYLVSPRDQGVQVELGQPCTVPVSTKLSGRNQFIVRDVVGVDLPTTPVRLPSSTYLSVSPQFQRGVVKISTSDSVPVTTVTVNSKTAESHLDYFDAGQWKKAIKGTVPNNDHVVELLQQSSIAKAIQQARTGSELWALFTVLALLFAGSEMMVAKFMARDRAAIDTV